MQPHPGAAMQRMVLTGAATVALWCHPAIADAQRNAAPTASATTQAAWDGTEVAGLRWRNVGPSRGGRSVAVVGVASKPLTYFAGYTGGGIWRTDDAGITWRNVSDGFLRTGSIGALAVAPSDENVIYAGSGEHAIRGQSSSYGDGVYKSTDMGSTWTHIGLSASRQIAAVRVHPANEDVVYVAVQGDRWKGSAERGVYRSRDGGATWTQLLKGLNATSGANDLVMDPSNPRILYAAFWDHQRQPWFVRSGGAGSGIWKSTDGGDTWTRLTRGLPTLMGKIGITVSPANPDRLFAIVEAEEGGLYRSDDAGKSWRRMSADRLIQTRSWYYMKTVADPANADVVWVLNAPLLRSIDGGATFSAVPATHSDNHALWINPAHPQYIINGNDGGASISLDGGRSWSSQENQPTAQFYHVTVDDAFPYKLYSGQQDNSSVVIKSRSDGRSIETRDWWNSAGCESANIGVSAKQPRYVYGGCYQGIIDELDQETGLTREIMSWPAMNLTERTDSTRYRFNWTAPIVVSQHDANVIYHAGNVLFQTRDRGTTWRPVSPDLTRNDKTRQGWGGGPITNEGAGGEVYGTIVVLAESPHDARTLYTGTDDGVVQLTRDGGATWRNVTPASLTDGLVNEIEISPHDPSTVTIAFRTDRLGDPTPHVFRSTDYGATWTRLVNGLRANEPVRVVREDPTVRGVLYAGTETGVYFSLNGGAQWQPFTGFPVVPVTDLDVRHGDLIAATEGRAFWILDDLSPIRQHAAVRDAARSPGGVHLLAPRDAVLAFGPQAGPPGTVGQNPPFGALVHYRLGAAPDSSARVSVEFLDAKGTVLRRFTNTEGMGSNRLSPRAGLNTLVWDLRRTAPTALSGVVLFGAPNGGARVMPGTYTVRLTVNGVAQSQSLTVRRDPRLEPVSDALLAERDSVAHLLSTRIGDMHDAVVRVRDIRTQLDAVIGRASSVPDASEVLDPVKTVAATGAALEPKLTTKAGNGQDIINYPNGLNGQFGFLLGQVEGHPAMTQQVRARLTEIEAQWRALRGEVEAFERSAQSLNERLQRAGLPIIVVKSTPAPGIM
jgi:photosystem II stability/assembly factor-like uncharacterized protein